MKKINQVAEILESIIPNIYSDIKTEYNWTHFKISAICEVEKEVATEYKKQPKRTSVNNKVVKNIDTGDELNTELLFWSPAEEKFYTDSFVTIISDGEVHTGKGLSANQDFSSYEILEPAGTIQIEEEDI